MKLKCFDHNKRVMVLDSGKTLHRQDGLECRSKHIFIGSEVLDPEWFADFNNRKFDLTRNAG